MICVSLGRSSHTRMREQHQELADEGVELVELRLDWLRRSPDVNLLIKDRPTPVVATCRRPQDMGKWRGSEDQRRGVLRQAIAGGVDYIDLEMDVAGSIPRYGETKRIVSFHDFRQTPANLEEIHKKLCDLDADYVKIVTTANSPVDWVRMLRLVKQSDVPTIGFCMGDIGVPSRILCGKFGSPWTYATFSEERVMAPGQLPYEEMRDLYAFDSIGPETKVFGLVGDPIGHSYSPLVHNTAFRHEGIDAVYVPFRVPPDRLAQTLKAFEWLDVQGMSVTIPHKEEAARSAKFTDDTVQQSGAANTLYRDDRGRWHATNTDYEAALSTLRDALDDQSDKALADKTVLILGAGGVARAIALGLIRAGCSVRITNRTRARGRELAKELDCQFIAWENRGSAGTDIVVNCTSVGMSPNVDDTPYAANWLRDDSVVFDTVYNPENTLLLKEARQRGCATASGLEMFIRQGAAQFQCFVNRPAPVDVMRDALRTGISPVRLK